MYVCVCDRSADKYQNIRKADERFAAEVYSLCQIFMSVIETTRFAKRTREFTIEQIFFSFFFVRRGVVNGAFAARSYFDGTREYVLAQCGLLTKRMTRSLCVERFMAGGSQRFVCGVMSRIPGKAICGTSILT